MVTRESHPPENQKLVIDLSARRVWKGQTELELTPLEYRMLVYLAQRAGQVVPYAELWQQVWTESGQFGNAEREVTRTGIKRLRRKLDDDAKRPTYVVSQRGIGVRLRSEAITLHKGEIDYRKFTHNSRYHPPTSTARAMT